MIVSALAENEPTVSGVALLLLGAVGVFVGGLNTIAGGGAFLALPLLISLGVPPGVANGTVRLGVLFQNTSSVATFVRRGFRDFDVLRKLVPPMVAGGLIGAYCVTRIPDIALKPLIGSVLIGWALFLLWRPDRFLKPPPSPRPVSRAVWLLTAVIGFYGGFLQAGVGFPLMALLIGWMGYGAVRGNYLKVTLVLAYTVLSLPIFVGFDKIDWQCGLALGGGMLCGGWLGTRLQIRVGARLVHVLVLVMLFVSGIMMFR